MTQWMKTPNGVADIPVGDWLIIMSDGKRGYCKSRKGSNCILHIINGHFHFDMKPVIAFRPFPDYNEDIHG